MDPIIFGVLNLSFLYYGPWIHESVLNIFLSSISRPFSLTPSDVVETNTWNSRDLDNKKL